MNEKPTPTSVETKVCFTVCFCFTMLALMAVSGCYISNEWGVRAIMSGEYRHVPSNEMIEGGWRLERK
jgi:hypothetical protein